MQNKFKNEMQKYFRFCPHCGSVFKLRMHHKSRELTCRSCGFIFWLNAKPTVSCFLLNDQNEILLTRRAITPHKDWWDVPGGFLELTEEPIVGIKREIREELGIHLIHIKPLGKSFLGVYRSLPIQITLNIYYISRISKNKKMKPQDDVAEAMWFSLKKLPSRIAFENNRKALRYLIRNRNKILHKIS